MLKVKFLEENTSYIYVHNTFEQTFSAALSGKMKTFWHENLYENKILQVGHG